MEALKQVKGGVHGLYPKIGVHTLYPKINITSLIIILYTNMMNIMNKNTTNKNRLKESE